MHRTKTLAEAQSAIHKLESDAALIIARRNEISGKLGVLESTAGERYLSGDNSAAMEIAARRAELDLIEKALVTLAGWQVAAGVEYRRAEAEDLRHQVAAKRGELAALELKTGKLLSQLSELECITYTAGILSSQHQGAWYAAGQREPEPFHAALVDLQPDPTNREQFAEPTSRRLRREIADLERKAEAIEAAIAPSDLGLVAQSLPEGKNWADSSYTNKPVASYTDKPAVVTE